MPGVFGRKKQEADENIPMDLNDRRLFFNSARSPSWAQRAVRPLNAAGAVCILVFGLSVLLDPDRSILGNYRWLPFMAGMCAMLAGRVCSRYGFKHARSLLQQHSYLLCSRCGYDLNRTESPGTCPECGTPFERETLARYWVDYLDVLSLRAGKGRGAEMNGRATSPD